MSILGQSEGNPTPAPRTTGRRPATVDAPLWAPGWVIQYTFGILAIVCWFWDKDSNTIVTFWVSYFLCAVIRSNTAYVRDLVVETEDE